MGPDEDSLPETLANSTRGERERLVLLCHQPPTSQTHDTHRDLERATPVSITSVDAGCQSTAILRTRTSLPLLFQFGTEDPKLPLLSQLVAGGPTPEDCPTAKLPQTPLGSLARLTTTSRPHL